MICKLKDLIDQRGMSQMELANKAGLSAAAIGRLYRNQFTRVDKETVEKLAKELGLRRINELFELED